VLDSRLPPAGQQGLERAAAAAAGAALIIFAHRENIRRLLRGTENKLKL
jgi:glycerol-3-phosphate acyltransferase PlsY